MNLRRRKEQEEVDCNSRKLSSSAKASLTLSPPIYPFIHTPLKTVAPFTSSGRNQPPVHMECHLGSTYAYGPKPNNTECFLPPFWIHLSQWPEAEQPRIFSLSLSLQVEKRPLSTWNATKALSLSLSLSLSRCVSVCLGKSMVAWIWGQCVKESSLVAEQRTCMVSVYRDTQRV
jgi:hypothetical protein